MLYDLWYIICMYYASLPYKVLFLLLVIEQPRVPTEPQLWNFILIEGWMSIRERRVSAGCWDEFTPA